MTRGVNPETGRAYRFKDRAGKRNGRLLFLRNVGITRHKHQIWEALCDCGNVTQTSSPNLTKSCGCYHSELAAERARARALPKDVKRQNVKANQKRQRERRSRDPIIAMQARLSRLHRHALARVNTLKTSPTFEQLGYTPKQFVDHIERQFLPGMNWSNMNEWQIDHIIPLSTAKCESDVIALNQLSNLRPLWSDENNKKKNKIVSLL